MRIEHEIVISVIEIMDCLSDVEKDELRRMLATEGLTPLSQLALRAYHDVRDTTVPDSVRRLIEEITGRILP